ncbi:hypothetical protein BYT27DRAFT_6673545 [Phlegmacium glaucopus]|nr:hypothetical protein BYT27DRAFT_6673545 [Phlegmacium glaucopus]
MIDEEDNENAMKLVQQGRENDIFKNCIRCTLSDSKSIMKLQLLIFFDADFIVQQWLSFLLGLWAAALHSNMSHTFLIFIM